MRAILAIGLTLMLGACGGGADPASENAAPTNEHAAADRSAARPAEEPARAVPAAREWTLPAGTTLRLELRSAVASDTSKVEDVVRARLRQPVVLDGVTVLPVGTEVSGVVTAAERSGRVKGLAHVAYRFDSLRVSDERYDIRTAPLVHEAEATKSEDATKIAVGAGAGAALGAILGGGDGAAKGAAIGGAAGTGAVLATRGEEVRVGPGAQVTTRLTEAVTVNVEQ